ncbi:MAG: hypothetical protein M3Y05_16530, partial [Gemmatimonadota bacterium]|nr:hypothetical protein [Gemmatimonadota bacterium]
MITKLERLVIVAVIVGGTLVMYVAIALLFVGTIDRFGMTPIYAAMSPRNAYVLWRARRDMTWNGIRIRVGQDYVLDPQNDKVRVHHLDSLSVLSLAPGMVFLAADSGRTRSFQRAEARCTASAEDECTVLHSTLRSGILTCHQHRGRRARPTFGQFEVWRCDDANGLSANFFGTPAECRQRLEIALKAFATAPAGAAHSRLSRLSSTAHPPHVKSAARIRAA